MRIYKKLIIDIQSGRQLEAESFDYRGPVAKAAPLIALLPAALGGATAAGTAAVGAGTIAANWGLLALTAGSAVMGIAQGQQQSAALKAEGDQAALASAEEAKRIRQRGAAQMGTARAIAGGQGTTLEGSPLLVLTKNAEQIELEAQDALYGGALKKRSQYFAAGQSRTAGIGNAIGGIRGTTLLTGFEYGYRPRLHDAG